MNTEIIGKALVVGALAVLVSSSSTAVAAVSSTVAVFCVGRALQKRWRL